MLYVPERTLIIMAPATDLGFVNSLQLGTVHFPSALHRGLVLEN